MLPTRGKSSWLRPAFGQPRRALAWIKHDAAVWRRLIGQNQRFGWLGLPA